MRGSYRRELPQMHTAGSEDLRRFGVNVVGFVVDNFTDAHLSYFDATCETGTAVVCQTLVNVGLDEGGVIV